MGLSAHEQQQLHEIEQELSTDPVLAAVLAEHQQLPPTRRPPAESPEHWRITKPDSATLSLTTLLLLFCAGPLVLVVTSLIHKVWLAVLVDLTLVLVALGTGYLVHRRRRRRR